MNNEDLFINACTNGILEVVKQLLTSTNKKKDIDINCLNRGFQLSCKEGNLNVAKYLLEKNFGHYIEKEIGFSMACSSGNLDIVKYLLTSHKLKKSRIVSGFKDASENGHLDIIKFLIFEKTDILKAANAEFWLKECSNKLVENWSEITKQIESWFELMDLNQKLEEELKSGEDKGKKVKI